MTTGVAFVAADAEVRRLKILYQLLARLSQASALDEIYQTTLASLIEATAADRASILLFDDDGVIRFKASRGLSDDYKRSVTGHTPWTAHQRGTRPVIVPDVRLGPDFLPVDRDAMRRESIRALAFIPLELDAGVFGRFGLYYPEPHECTRDEIEITQAIASHMALAIERKRAELALVHTKQRLQAILDNSPAVIFLKDLEGRYVLVNRRHEELFGISQNQIIGRTDREVFPSGWAEQFQANDRAVLAADTPISIEEHAPQDDGVHTYVSVKFPLRNPDGSVSGVCGIATDITERKILETASRRLAAIVESSGDAIIGKDLNGIVTSWNAGAARIFGYTAGEVLGKPVSILAAPDGTDEMAAILARVREGETVENLETRRRRKDGRVIDVALTVSPVRDASGAMVGASGIARDITDQKLAEQERALLLDREREAHRTAELLNQVGPRLSAQLDTDKLVQEVTDVATALVGAQFGAFFHNAVDEKGESYMLYTLSGVRREAFANFPMPRNTELFGATFRGEGVVRCADVRRDPRYGKNSPHRGMPEGHLPVCSYLAAPVVARSGEVLGGLFFGHAEPGRFTESHESIVAGIAAQAAIALDNARLFEQMQSARADLTRSNDDLRRANRDLEIFAYSASHDLQEPLRNITIAAQLLERNWAAGARGNDDALLRNILSSSRRMTNLTRDLLAYAEATRYEEGAPLAADAAEVLAGVLENMRAAIGESRIRITADALPHAAVHAGRLAQLFQNLISNAIKYRRQEEPFVHVAGVERDGWCVFSVVDNGIGIEPQFAEQIFGLFKRLHGRDEYPGSGIGLGICRRIVEQYGGRIWLEQSAPGKGSTFCFSLPAAL
jgi:PAS domain S-box-containing protein